MRIDADLTELIPTYPSVTYRRGNNLNELLVHSHLKTETSSGTEWLRSPFINPIDNKDYEIRQFFFNVKQVALSMEYPVIAQN